MPELPDIAAYLRALERHVLHRQLVHVRLLSAFVLRSVDPPVSVLEGRTVAALRRVGKRIAFGFDGDLWLVVHLMIAGRLHWKRLDAKLGGRQSLAALEFEHGMLVLTEAGSKRRASMHVVRGRDALEAMDPGGIDVMSSSLETFRAALTAENRTLKRALTDPRVLSGIGNAYSDEILHLARLSPLLQTHRLTEQQWERLFTATQASMREWTERLCAEAETRFPEKVTAFRPEMRVHGRYGKPCPACGNAVQRIRYADNETNYCAECQTEGRVLADRSLSRLLGADWPRTLDELETLRRR